MSTQNPFHEGELAVQERAGALAPGRNSGRMIADAIIPGALKFVKKQPMIVAGSVDGDANVWSSIVVGPPGFLQADPHVLEIDLASSPRNTHDPLWENVVGDPRIGLLVIDLRSRARLRVNGRVKFSTRTRLQVTVESAFPNCPKYIQRRSFRPAVETENQLEINSTTGEELDDRQLEWIVSADTLFVASDHPDRGVDASHRGGNPGFIHVLSSTRLRIPDYVGNGMFNTLGNFTVNSRAGLLLPDFESGRTLQLTGRAEILWDVQDSAEQTAGTQRFWEFNVDRWIQSERALRGTVEFLDYSPHNPAPAR